MERDNFVTAEKVKNAFLGLEHRYHTGEQPGQKGQLEPQAHKVQLALQEANRPQFIDTTVAEIPRYKTRDVMDDMKFLRKHQKKQERGEILVFPRYGTGCFRRNFMSSITSSVL